MRPVRTFVRIRRPFGLSIFLTLGYLTFFLTLRCLFARPLPSCLRNFVVSVFQCS